MVRPFLFTHVGADNRGHDRGGNNNAANPQARQCQKAVQLVQIMGVGYGQGPTSCRTGQHSLRDHPIKRSIILPAVIRIDETIRSSRLRPLSALKRHKTIHAPTMMPNATGSPRTPQPIGSWPYTLYDCVGQKRMTEKKLAPEIKVMMSVMIKIRGVCHRRRGNMGYLAPHFSHATNAMKVKIPRINGASTCAERHLYYANQLHRSLSMAGYIYLVPSPVESLGFESAITHIRGRHQTRTHLRWTVSSRRCWEAHRRNRSGEWFLSSSTLVSLPVVGGSRKLPSGRIPPPPKRRRGPQCISIPHEPQWADPTEPKEQMEEW